MSMKAIMVSLSGSAGEEVALSLGLSLGQRFDARATALYVAPDPSAQLPYLGEGLTTGVVEDMMTAIAKETAEREAKARKEVAFAAAALGVDVQEGVDGSGFRVVFKAVRGGEDTVAEEGRVHDLTVVAGPGAAEPTDLPALHAAIMETGRPVLVSPPTVPGEVGKRPVVAWNGSLQAARALGAALPLMQGAVQALVVTVDEGTPRNPTPEMVVDYLAQHAIPAEARHLSGEGMSAGEALLAEVEKTGGDLLVMGAYTHSRLRELILGGATRDILAMLEVPVLMTH